jgi:hypothetical protein
MSNEEVIEEILVESYRLGIYERVFDKFRIYIMKMDRADAYKKAFEESKLELENKTNDEIF